MYPVLFTIAGMPVTSFFFMVMIASFAGTAVAVHFARKEGASEVAILDMAIIAVIAGVIGARIFHVLFEDTALTTGDPHYYWNNPMAVFYFWQGGFVSLGAFIGALVSWLTYYRIRKLDTLRYLDLAGMAVPVIIFFVRVGCILAGCCYGKVTDFWIYLSFPEGSTAHYYMGDAHLHATQLYNMLNAVVMFGVIYIVYLKRKHYGVIGATFLIYYGVTRFFIEFLRGDTDRGMYFGGLISNGQIVMTGFLLLGIGMLWYARRGEPILLSSRTSGLKDPRSGMQGKDI
jgi:phosphatidylglycerol:prolipoprotein diacylglycerol transferase